MSQRNPSDVMTNLLKEKMAQTRKALNTCVLDGLLSAKRAKIDGDIVDKDEEREEGNGSMSDYSMNPSSPDESNLLIKSDDPENKDSSFDPVGKVDLAESASNLTIDLPGNTTVHSLVNVNSDQNSTTAQTAATSNDGSIPVGLVDPNGSYFTCSTCPKYFLNESNLKHHNSLYHSEKSFTCEICGKAFRFRSNLAEHRSVHTSLKPYVCKFCGKSSRLKGNLTKHILKHHKKEQSDFIGKDDIIIRKGKKSIKDPAAVDFLEKSMIVLTPDSMNSAALHLFNLAGGNKNPASSTNGNVMMNVNDNGSAESNKITSSSLFSQSHRFSNPISNIASPSYSDQIQGVHESSPSIDTSKQQPCQMTSSAIPHQQPPLPPGSRLFPTASLPSAANALAATSLIPPNFQFLNFDHLFFALNKTGVTSAPSKSANQQFLPSRNVEQVAKQDFCRHDGQMELRSSRFESDNETEDEGKRSVSEVVASLGVGCNKPYQQHGGVSSSCVNGTKCETCGKHFRKSTNLAAHLAAKHGLLGTPASCKVDENNDSNQIMTRNNNFGSVIVEESSFTSCSTPHFYESMKTNRNLRKISPTVSESPLTGKEKSVNVNGCDFPKLNCSSLSYNDQNHVENVLVKNAREMREILDEFRRQQKSSTSDYHHQNQQQQHLTVDSNIFSNLETKIGRIENQAEISLATLYSLVQMQTEMNLAFFQFKSDVYEQLRLLQNLLKNHLNSSSIK
uniref:C2H2-type domain-containing protein n=1 Tax=Romanomermis culicivorax TaxID=13658 RepID=A0A915HN97_ROMCU